MTLPTDAPSIVSQVQAIVRKRMAGQQAGHGFDHVARVLQSAREICQSTEANIFVVELAALLHDVGDAKFHDGVERSAQFSREILAEFDIDAATVEQIAFIVDNISFRKGVDASELCLEGKIVQDADRLDALGAIGIVRTIEYGAAVGQPFYLRDPGDAKTGIGHFDDKLFKLKGLLNTDAAIAMADQRETFMRQFVAQFLEEQGVPKTSSPN
ncbi:HD domain-containing protein [Planctomycetes bacterium K23_9]